MTAGFAFVASADDRLELHHRVAYTASNGPIETDSCGWWFTAADTPPPDPNPFPRIHLFRRHRAAA